MKTGNHVSTLAIFLSFACLQWLQRGGLSLSQLSAMLLLVLLMFRVLSSPIALYKDSATRGIGLYTTFVFILMLGLGQSSNLQNGLFAVARSGAYVATAALLYVVLTNTREQELRFSLAGAIFLAGPIFYFGFIASALAAGVNVPRVIIEGIASGNANYIQYHLFNKTFNVASIGGEVFSSAARHGVMILLSALALLHLCLRTSRTRYGTILSWAMFATAFLSLSRTVTISLLGIGLMFSARYMLSRELYLRYVVAAMVGAYFFLTWVLLSADSSVSQILAVKFGKDIVNNPRIFEYAQVINLMGERPFFGWGTGTPIPFNLTGSEYPHNFILYGWHQAGLAGAAASLAFSFFVAKQILFAFRHSILQQNHNNPALSNIYIVSASLLFFVLIRLMFSKAGLLALSEWIAFTIGTTLLSMARRNLAHLNQERIGS